MHSVIRQLFTRTTNENEMDLSSREKLCSKILFTVPAKGSFTISDYKDINIELSYYNKFESINIENFCAKWKFRL